MNVLALDLGTKTGWALRKELRQPINRVDYVRYGGTWNLSDPESVKIARAEGWDRRCDGRFNTLCFNIQQMVEDHEVGAVVFEDVLFSQTTLQTQLWATFRAAIWAVRRWHPVAEGAGESNNFGQFHIDCLNTATLKKISTGHGNADKAMMSAHLLKRYPDQFVKNQKPTENCFLLRKTGERVDDNEVDARHLLDAFSHL